MLTTEDGKLAAESKTVPAADAEDLFGDVIFEQDPIQILNALLPLYINGQVRCPPCPRVGGPRERAGCHTIHPLTLPPTLTNPTTKQVLRMLQESVASELGARMAAMQSASDNAAELADKLSVIYNRARQVCTVWVCGVLVVGWVATKLARSLACLPEGCA